MAKDEKTGSRSQEWFSDGTFGFAHNFAQPQLGAK
jgi:hypothetical protein